VVKQLKQTLSPKPKPYALNPSPKP
jgi:hypothetical protein